MHEDSFHDVNADITLTSSNNIQHDLIKFFKKENNKIIVSKEFSRFYPRTPFDLPDLINKNSYSSLEIFKESLGIDLNKKIALFIGDPGELYNSKEHKYMDEYNFLCSIKSNEEYFSIVKKHPSDTSNISNIALSDSNNHNAIVSGKIDIYEALISSDVVVSQSSTAVMEAIILKKFIILSNYLSTNFYKNAVEYGVAHYAFKPSDFLQLLDEKDSYMLNYEDKMNKYIDEVYSSDETLVDTSAIIYKAINE
jgi:CDP-glycerol glycerophosphotransferase (TagB/SpsB family)